jgi:hypothetical protein
LKKFNLSKRTAAALKLSFTALIWIFLAWKADWPAIGHALRAADPYKLSAVVLAMFFCVTISAVKWQVLLAIHDISYRLRDLHRYYLIGVFFNNFLPSTIGGDVYRIYKTLSNPRSRTRAVLAVFLERLTGIWALLVLGWISGLVIILRAGGTAPFMKPLTLLFTGGVALPVAGVFFLIWFGNRTTVAARIPYIARWLRDHLADFRRQKAKGIQVLLLSFFFHLFSIGWITLLFKAIGTDFPVPELAVTVAISNLVSILPISINGIGLLDGSFLYVAVAFGVDYDRALTFLLLMRSITFLISLVGGAFYLRERRQVDLDELKQEIEGIKESIS